TTIYIALSAKERLKQQDWSGSAEISEGRILKVEKDSGSADTIKPDMSWNLVYGRAIPLGTTAKKPTREKGLVITVAPPDAVLTLKTKGGTFSFALKDVTKKGIPRLDGNVIIYAGDRRRSRKGRRKHRRLKPAQIAGEIESTRITDPQIQHDWPAVAVTPGGATWMACVRWNGKDKDDIVLMRQPPGGTWGEPIVLDDGCWDHYRPAVAALGESALVVWSAQKEGNFDLYSARIPPDGKAQRIEPLTQAPYSDFNPRVIAQGDGRATVVWQALRSGQSDIYARRLSDGKWGEEIRVSPSNANDWQPALAQDSTGTIWITWDNYANGNYDVFLRRLDQNGLGPVIPITTEPTAQFHSTVAVDNKDRVWVAWDDGGKNWGKDFSRSSAAEGSRGLHYSRSIGMRVYADGRVMDPKIDFAKLRTGRMARYAELPQLATDGAGTLWMVFRHWTEPRPTEIYHIYVTKLTPDGWSMPWRFKNSSGRNTQWADIAAGPDGALKVAFASDLRSPDNLPKDQIHALVYGIHLATLPRGEGLADVEMAETKRPQPAAMFVKRTRATLSVGGKTYTLMYGDCHRHTDIRGHSAVDASILDTFRYAMDAAQLDFLGLGDHNEVFGGRWPDGLRDYQWWWTQKAVDLFDCPPHFVGIYSYEHSMSSPAGHRNLLFLKRGAPLRAVDRASKKPDNPANQPPELWKWIETNVLTQPGQKCVVVPHTFAAGPLASWNWPNPPFDCLLEIYQGCRGSYEAWGLPPGEKRGPTQTQKKGHFAQDALAAGNRYGFVSFSDHGSTHNSYAGVWAGELNRRGVIEAMLARRTFAATDEIVLTVTTGDRTVGEQLTTKASSPPMLKIHATAPDTILRVDVVKDGKYIWTQRPEAKEFHADFVDKNAKAGECYYYVRLFQRDPENPKGDPEIAWASPIFVKYAE
ncbi:MAG: hypothetical protein GXP25_00780, partial [Planctomycetes bacterium]|nr:hypothetical protein [Planctomycetota bacterium]